MDGDNHTRALIAQLTERITFGDCDLATINLYKRIRGSLYILLTHGFN